MHPQQRWLLETSYRALKNGMSSDSPSIHLRQPPVETIAYIVKLEFPWRKQQEPV